MTSTLLQANIEWYMGCLNNNVFSHNWVEFPMVLMSDTVSSESHWQITSWLIKIVIHNSHISFYFIDVSFGLGQREKDGKCPWPITLSFCYIPRVNQLRYCDITQTVIKFIVIDWLSGFQIEHHIQHFQSSGDVSVKSRKIFRSFHVIQQSEDHYLQCIKWNVHCKHQTWFNIYMSLCDLTDLTNSNNWNIVSIPHFTNKLCPCVPVNLIMHRICSCL